MNYIIGLDRGGTKTKCVVTDLFRHEIYNYTGFSSNLLQSGPQENAAEILDVIQQCFEKLVISVSDIAAICIGAAGAGREEDASLLKNELVLCLNKLEYNREVLVVGDNEITLEGAFDGNSGIILISGTGSICYGKNEEGKKIRIGGYGRLLGDEGSGYSIAAKGIRCALQSYDDRKEKTLLKERIFSTMGCSNSDDVIRMIYKEKYDIPILTKTVLECAELGDVEAKNILEEESNLLIDHVKACVKHFNNLPVPLVLEGSLLTNENIYKSIVISKLEQNEAVYLQVPKYPPQLGAVIMALKHIQKK